MFRRAAGASKEFSGIGKSPVTIEIARPMSASSARFRRTTSGEVSRPSCDARMQRAW